MNIADIPASPAHHALQAHAQSARNWHMRDLFAADPDRFSRMSLEAAGIFLDYSKNRLDAHTLQLLFALAREKNLAARRDAMFAGAPINNTEGRAVLHTALRAPRELAPQLAQQDVGADVHSVLTRMRRFSDQVRSGQWRGYDGRIITDVVNIGIGGSDLGPKMAAHALRSYSHPRLKMHFVSNVDGHDLDAVLQQIEPATSLFIVASKTFTTIETMMNARSARAWLLAHGGADAEAGLAKHFVAVSTNLAAVTEFGIAPENMFPFWDWVGGRYSLWSAIGLPLMLALGHGYFGDLLAGAHAMDRHFCEAELEQNLPVILAMCGVWNRNYLGFGAHSIACYHQDLAHFPAYLQQLEMESNGKSVRSNGQPVQQATCPLIWGERGTNGQHAYFQLLHQGTDIIPLDFIAALNASHDLPGHQDALLANCFAQAEALMRGKQEDEVRAELRQAGMNETQQAQLLPHKLFAGNRPSNMILLEMLTPHALGALIALYEHKTFVQGVIWDLNSFDQWGVELGKALAATIQRELAGGAAAAHDSSTAGLIARARQARF
ncbi:glucose-6-phosphate isomerase [Massilia sp. W12]|uniref:glucose-6-phosphate isomerase n=1 Tax=Massilia sp. W12 TaxID=3126507 RepID=UPI0030D5F570